MHFYGLSDQQLLAMPLKRFWFLSRSVDRIAAEQDLRLLSIGASVQSGESYKDMVTGLHKQMGKVVIMDEVERAQTEVLDRSGLSSLKGIGKVG